MESFDLKKLNEEESKGQYHAGIKTRFIVLGNLDAVVHVNSAWDTITGNTTI
jgi:hypothetical protein